MPLIYVESPVSGIKYEQVFTADGKLEKVNILGNEIILASVYICDGMDVINLINGKCDIVFIRSALRMLGR